MATPVADIVPAQLGFLAIYNPSLGTTDATIDDQIVYYASVNTHNPKRRHQSRGTRRPTDSLSQAERNERLRQIGLAQGMVEFSKSFSGDNPVDTIETEKSRIILHELEPGWWILASIDLTKLPASSPAANPKDLASADASVEYSSREVKPAALLLQDLLRAHSVFLLHHDSSLSAMFVRSKRSKFTAILGRYWDLYLSTWSVLLHGNPARNVFGGIKIAACGELGIGVGEEERGSGEREVLEGLVGRIEGLVDLVVSKFGAFTGESAPQADLSAASQAYGAPGWLATGNEPGGEDGAVFLGVGALSKHSLRDITFWMEDLYTWGEGAYGVSESPTSIRQSRRPQKPATGGALSIPLMGPPPPVTELAQRSKPSPAPDSSGPKSPIRLPKPRSTDSAGDASNNPTASSTETESGSMDKYVNYLKLGYGTYWSIGGSSAESTLPESHQRRQSVLDDASGYYLIGLMGEVEENSSDTEDNRFSDMQQGEYNSRTLLRTLTVELESELKARTESQVTKDLGSHENEVGQKHHTSPGNMAETSNSSFDSQDRNKAKKLRVVVYVNKPFIFTFLFNLYTDSLAWDPLYKSLHHQLSPLRRPLANSTAYRPGKPDIGSAIANIYDLVWDPEALTVHSTIPNIPSSNANPQPGEQLAWSRVEALNTHMQILHTFMGTRGEPSELERTCKTSRGWWIVWRRILEREARLGTPPSPSRTSEDSLSQRASSEAGEGDDEPSATHDYTVSKEIFLIRKASDHGGGLAARSVSAPFVGSGGWADGASRLAQGIGVDTKKYIEGLLSLNR